MPVLRRRGGEAEASHPPVPWELNVLLRNGAAPLEDRPADEEHFSVALVLGAGHDTPAAAGLPAALPDALREQGVDLKVFSVEAPGGAALADVVLAAGWRAAPAVLTLAGVRARAVLPTVEPPAFPGSGWTEELPVLGPRWLGGELPPAADAVYRAMPVHRRDDLVLVHGEDPFGMLAAVELHERRPDIEFAVTGVRLPVSLPFPAIGVEPGGERVAHAFNSATVGLAPPVRGWRPAAVAMQACGLAVVAPDDEAGRTALGDTASLARDPLAAADAVEELLDDFEKRAGLALAGMERVARWDAVAAELATVLRAL